MVGQAPIKGANRQPAWRGQSGKRIVRLCGLDPEKVDVLDLVDGVNVFAKYTGKNPSGKGDLFPFPRAYREAAKLERDFISQGTWNYVLLAGTGVAKAFLEADRDYWSLFDRGGKRWAVIPHPSYGNLLWNDPKTVLKGEGFFRVLLADRIAEIREELHVDV